MPSGFFDIRAKLDIPGAKASSSLDIQDNSAGSLGGFFPVDRPALEAAMEDAHEAIAEGSKCPLMEVTCGPALW